LVCQGGKDGFFSSLPKKQPTKRKKEILDGQWSTVIAFHFGLRCGGDRLLCHPQLAKPTNKHDDPTQHNNPNIDLEPA